MTDTTQPPAETLAEALDALKWANDRLRDCGKHVDFSLGMVSTLAAAEKRHIAGVEVLAALTRRAGGDAIPAGEGEPVAWRWERRGRFGPEIGAWEQVFTPYPPDKWPEDDRRNIVPLYATPKPPAGGDAGVEP